VETMAVVHIYVYLHQGSWHLTFFNSQQNISTKRFEAKLNNLKKLFEQPKVQDPFGHGDDWFGALSGTEPCITLYT
jgi:hypothetical protein